MAKFLRPNKVVLVLNGRYAGKKAVIVKNTVEVIHCLIMADRLLLLYPLTLYLIFSIHFDEGDKSGNRKFGCALVVGVERTPLKVTRSMNKKKIAKRSRVKPFVKVINYTHLMPTRYSFDLENAVPVSSDMLKDPAKKKEIRRQLKKVLVGKYKSGQSKWFFQKLRF